MSLSATKTTQSHDQIAAVLSQAQARMAALGVNLAAWDSQGRRIGAPVWNCEFCKFVQQSGLDCTSPLEALAREVIAGGKTIHSTTACGGSCIAMPVTQRRRLLCVIVVSFPTVESLYDGRLEAFCLEHGIDIGAGTGPSGDIRRNGGQTSDLAALLAWMIDRELTAQTGQNEIETLSTNLATTYEELSLLYRISGSMKVNQQPQDFFRNICQELLEVMHIPFAAAVIYAHPPVEEEDLVVIAGSADLNADQIKLLAATNLANRFISNRPMLDNALTADPQSGLGSSIQRVIAAPMVADKNLLGMIVGFNKTTGDFDSTDLKLIASIANQAAIFQSNSLLYAELQDLLMGVLHALTASIDAKDPYTSGHSERVAMLSRRIAEELKFTPERVHQVYLTGLLHDVGKIGVPESVLCKPGRLTDDEYERIKLHPSIGAKILGGIRHLDNVVSGILTHHERPDGKGYPQGLAGDQVPLDGRIIGLADVFDAMTSDRTYRKALPLPVAVEEIRRFSGTQFDAKLVDTFLAMDLERVLEDIRQPARIVFPAEMTQEFTR